MLGEPQMAIAYQVRSMRLSPLDPLRGRMRAGTGFAHPAAGRSDEAVSWAQRACSHQPNFPVAWRLLASSNALSGRFDQAQKALARALQLDPRLEMSTLSHYATLRRAEDFDRYAEGLRLAGLSRRDLWGSCPAGRWDRARGKAEIGLFAAAASPASTGMQCSSSQIFFRSFKCRAE
jgi:tetratricopeptide (TPR) repeat protein